MKLLIKLCFSLFFAIAIGVHVYNVIQPDDSPFWWHCIYYITYGGCWWMFLSKNKNRLIIYAAMAAFPFITHLYYGYIHLPAFDTTFWICVLVCILLPLGYLQIKKEVIA